MKKKKGRIRNLILFGTIKDLIDRYEYSELQEELGCLCKKDALLPLMQDAYIQLKAVIPETTDRTVQVVERWEYCSPMLDMNCHIRTRSGEILSPVAICDSWPELMSMPVYCLRRLRMTEKELLAGILWEVTYYKDSYLENRGKCNCKLKTTEL